jgi:hypothetical protein
MKLFKSALFSIEKDFVGNRIWLEFLYGFPNWMRFSIGLKRWRILDRLYVFNRLFVREFGWRTRESFLKSQGVTNERFAP